MISIHEMFNCPLLFVESAADFDNNPHVVSLTMTPAPQVASERHQSEGKGTFGYLTLRQNQK